ncbi:hypothetical protein A5779_21665 [Mycolicibacterium peregrinum]|uniref:Uncharacterized protein n=1 Tax=Mycolicibacterium peregrinum TaxID=43304 RepID=A0A1A0W8R5_MYCPR|nr:hypothetical protein A5779_21665 [Mycolicibacterium peregrinum]
MAASPGLFVLEQAGELGPPGVGYGSGQPTIAQHPCHVQVLDDELVVVLDHLIGNLMQKMVPGVGDMSMMPCQLSCSVLPVA